jgi:hypothetical protein
MSKPYMPKPPLLRFKNRNLHTPAALRDFSAFAAMHGPAFRPGSVITSQFLLCFQPLIGPSRQFLIVVGNPNHLTL